MKRRLTLIAPAILVCVLVIGAAGATVHGGLPEVNSLPMLDMDMVVVAEPPVVGGVITVTVTVRDHLGTPLIGAPVTLWIYEPGLPERIIQDYTGPDGQFEHQYPGLIAGQHGFRAMGNWPGHIPGSVIANLWLR